MYRPGASSFCATEPQLVNSILDGFLTVKPEDIQAVAKKYLRDDKRAIVFRRPVTASLPAGPGENAAPYRPPPQQLKLKPPTPHPPPSATAPGPSPPRPTSPTASKSPLPNPTPSPH